MNIKGEKPIIDLKRKNLKAELNKPEEEQNPHKIRRLKESIQRHKSIAKSITKRRKWKKWKKDKRKK